MESFIVPVYKEDDKTDCNNNNRGISILPATYKILSHILLSRLNQICRRNKWGSSMWISNQQVGYWSYILRSSNTWEKKWEYNEAVRQSFIYYKKAYDSFRREILCNILIQFCIPMRLVMLIKMCLNDRYSRVRVGNYLSDMFAIRKGFKQGDALSPIAFHLCFRVHHYEGSGNTGWLEIKWYT